MCADLLLGMLSVTSTDIGGQKQSTLTFVSSFWQCIPFLSWQMEHRNFVASPEMCYNNGLAVFVSMRQFLWHLVVNRAAFNMEDTAALASETVSLWFKWLKPGSSVVTVFILPNTVGLHLVVNLTGKYITQFFMNCYNFLKKFYW